MIIKRRRRQRAESSNQDQPSFEVSAQIPDAAYPGSPSVNRRKETMSTREPSSSPVPWQLALGVEDEDEAWNMAAACLSAKMKVNNFLFTVNFDVHFFLCVGAFCGVEQPTR